VGEADSEECGHAFVYATAGVPKSFVNCAFPAASGSSPGSNQDAAAACGAAVAVFVREKGSDCATRLRRYDEVFCKFVLELDKIEIEAG
jgi:hypothetical protein